MEDQAFIVSSDFIIGFRQGLEKRNTNSESLENIEIKSDDKIVPSWATIFGNHETQNRVSRSNGWITIEQSQLLELILEAFVDFDKKKILNIISEKSLTIREILYRCKMPTTAGYRKVNSLIKAGFIVPSGVVSIRNGKKVKKYISIIEDVKIYIDKENISVKVRLKKQ